MTNKRKYYQIDNFGKDINKKQKLKRFTENILVNIKGIGFKKMEIC